jgi:hypothetical protein
LSVGAIIVTAHSARTIKLALRAAATPPPAITTRRPFMAKKSGRLFIGRFLYDCVNFTDIMI